MNKNTIRHTRVSSICIPRIDFYINYPFRKNKISRIRPI
nr:MAG TPA: hypothetical protein [Caudoviricetes sp.]DAT16628.1 MAG TPA: hypothetical protein [Caudoviricetes sp.]DAW73528.1 MAG TPA: hypothetical protein [Caudoviricetes sp.]DAX26120.1 MAG TPA: hypothetical protein [Caudoviricetes sp.]